MHFFIATFLCFLFSAVLEAQADCPPSNGAIQRMTIPLEAKFKEVCKQGIRPGGAADWEWLSRNVIPYYVSQAFIGKEWPKSLNKDIYSILTKCHKNNYNYCTELDRVKVASCVKGLVGSLLPKYALQVAAYCPVLDKIVGEWPSKHQAKALSFVTAYCATKGKKC
ncbi:hypothetical protein B0H34DRAFT_675886 [Crassisporium funariophilum]|nr:hypothetical protein B0H34DRAFT_675886 [Crassisporium funariophilum]